jgi:anti-anti-sigma factor
MRWFRRIIRYGSFSAATRCLKKLLLPCNPFLYTFLWKQKPKRSEKMETAPDLSITVERWGEWHILILSGKFVVKTLSLVRKRFEEVEAAQKPVVALDLTGVSQLDSGALTIILNFQQRLRQKTGRLAIIGPGEEIREMFSLVGFSSAVPVYKTREIFEQSVGSK